MMDARWQKRLTESSGSLSEIDEFEELRSSKFSVQRHEKNEN